MKLTTVQRDAILAGLRLLQSNLAEGTLDPDIEAIAFDSGEGITIDGIDALCNTLNGAG